MPKNKSFEKCPKCGSEHITGEPIMRDAGELWQTIVCQKCGFSWNEVYMFYRCEDVDTCEPLDAKGRVIKNILLDDVAKLKLS